MAINNLSFDEGLVEVKINNDPNRVIKFNPGDLNIVTRYNKMVESIGSMDLSTDVAEGEDKLKLAADQMQKIESALREQFNYLFNSDVYDIIFNGQSPLCIVGKDKNMLCEVVINAIGDMISDACGKSVDTLNLKMKKYTAKYQPQDHKPKRVK